MHVIHWSLFLFLFSTTCFHGSYICCAAGQIAPSSLAAFWSGTIIRNLVFTIHKPAENMASFSFKEGNRAALSSARWLTFRLPPYDTPRAAPCNNLEFHIDRTHAAGGVCEQTKNLSTYVRIQDMNIYSFSATIWATFPRYYGGCPRTYIVAWTTQGGLADDFYIFLNLKSSCTV